MLFVLLVVLCVLYVVWTWRLRTSVSPNKPPFYQGVLPIIGHLHLLIGDSKKLYTLLTSISRECGSKGGVIRCKIGTIMYYVITDQDDILTAANACPEKSYLYNFLQRWLRNGLLTARGAIWQRHRKLLNPAFNTRVLYGYLDTFNSQARSLVKDLSPKADKEPFDITSYLKVAAVKTVCLTNFGINMMENKQSLTSYIKATDAILSIILQRIQNIWLQSDLIFKLSGYERKQKEMVKIVRDKSKLIIQKKREAMQSYKVIHIEGSQRKPYKPFLELLLDLAKEGTFTEQEVEEEVETAAVASYDTTSAMLFFALANIGTYPHVQEKLEEELKQVFGDSDRNVEKEDIPKLVYTEAILNESLRMYPPALGVLRYVDKDVRLKKYTMPAGSNCILMLYGLNRGPAWGKDADEFRPERWLNPQELPATSIHYATFGLGKRSCIGKSFAMLSMKTTLVHLIRNYRVIADINKIEIKFEFVSWPIAGHYICLEKKIK